MTNPYAPTVYANAASPSLARNRLLYIWIWLPFTALVALATTPADAFSILYAMAFALPCFLTGVTWTSDLNAFKRWVLSAANILVAAPLAYLAWPASIAQLVLGSLMYGAINFVLGAKSNLGIRYKRRLVIITISTAYIIGLLLGPLGCIILVVPSVLIVNRNAVQDAG